MKVHYTEYAALKLKAFNCTDGSMKVIDSLVHIDGERIDIDYFDENEEKRRQGNRKIMEALTESIACLQKENEN